jgi:hypothetical protein
MTNETGHWGDEPAPAALIPASTSWIAVARSSVSSIPRGASRHSASPRNCRADRPVGVGRLPRAVAGSPANGWNRRNLAVSVHRDQGAESMRFARVRHRQFNNRQRTLAPSPCFRQTKPRFSTSALRYYSLQCRVGFWAGSDASIWRRARLQDNKMA